MKRIFYIFLVLIIGIVIFVWYAGAFEKIQITDTTDGPYVIAGLEHKGSYSKIPNTFMEVEKILGGLDIKMERTLGIYNDDPSKVEEADLRSFAAAIIEGDALNQIQALSATSLKLDTIENNSSLVVDLYARSAFSYMIYPMKVYPAFEQMMTEKGYTPAIAYEVYEVDHKNVRYVWQYSK
ncbi:MAG: hypothetical protein HKN75_02205 [Bacteroidia bacterium]|nr:hypothetical protein [Bacteroidia bacterium]